MEIHSNTFTQNYKLEALISVTHHSEFSDGRVGDDVFPAVIRDNTFTDNSKIEACILLSSDGLHAQITTNDFQRNTDDGSN